jgi:MerR family mercuric resistance operon transcriptional regulator
MADFTISGLAQAGGVGVETIRYYQRRGLIDEPHRPPGGTRRYGPGALRRLRFIKGAQGAGFTLQEIKELLELDSTEDRADVRRIAAARIAALDAKIEELQVARQALHRLFGQCGSAKPGPCPILAAFETS